MGVDVADQPEPSSLDQSPVLLRRDPRISALFALLGALIVLCVLFLMMGGDRWLGIAPGELEKRTPVCFALMFMCFAAAGWIPVSALLKPTLGRMTLPGGQ